MNITKLIDFVQKIETIELEKWILYLKTEEKKHELHISVLKKLHKNHSILKKNELSNIVGKRFELLGTELSNNHKLNKVIAELIKGIDQFVKEVLIPNNRLSEQYELLKFYRDRQLVEKMERCSEQMVQSLENIDGLETEKYFYLHKMYSLTGNLNLLKDMSSGMEDNAKKDFYIDVYFISIKLISILSALTSEKIYSKKVIVSFHESVMEALEKEKAYTTIPSIKTLLTAIYLLKRNEVQDYRILKSLAAEGFIGIGEHTIKTIYSIMQNYCALAINNGQDEFRQEIFELYKLQLNQGTIFTVDKIISHDVYMNIITIACRLNELEWAEDFLNNYKEYLLKEMMLDAFHLNKARIKFYKKDYDEVIQLLSQIEYINIFYNTDARKLLIQTYYELKEWNLLVSAINSFKIFIHRNTTLSSSHVLSNKNFANFMLKLSTLPFKNEKRAKQLEQELSDINPIAERNWLREKVSLLRD